METKVINNYLNGHTNPAMDYQFNNYEAIEMNDDPSHHREMAVDVPAGFVGTKKEQPRYPNGGGRLHQGYSSPPAEMTAEEKKAQLERIERYEEDLRQRRQQQQNFEREQDFLRTSLRDSKKLQALKESNSVLPSSFVNPNFDEYEEMADASPTHEASRASTLPIRIPNRPDPTAIRPFTINDIFNQLATIQTMLPEAEDQKDVAVLAALFNQPGFVRAVNIHNLIVSQSMEASKHQPAALNSRELFKDVLNSTVASPDNPNVVELVKLLQSSNVQSLLYAHDEVAKLKSEPVQAADEEDEQEYVKERISQYNEDSIKIIRLQKTADPLGATVRNDGESVIVGRIVKGGAAEKSGLLHEGDEILEINGIDIRGKTVNEVCDLMANMTGTLTFLIVPSQDYKRDSFRDDSADVIHIRAHFNYDPEEDMYIPCRELGISFVRGDILHVINQDDVNWWQAYREGEEDQALAGLIPSSQFHQQLETIKLAIVADKKENSKKKQRCRCISSSNKKRKQLYNSSSEDIDTEDILSYEEVAMYYPQPNRKRPIVLIGPPNVGRKELRDELMGKQEDRFMPVLPQTSREPRPDETEGIDYHFVTRAAFEADIRSNKFVEYGEFEKNLYGTTLEAIRRVVNSGKVCLLILHPESLRILKASDLKPYVIFVAPPNLDKLRQLRHILSPDGKVLTDNDLKNIMEKAREIEENYGHFFDHYIVNYDFQKAQDELMAEINRLDVDPQWVPKSWVS